jgi:hypothetical protein
LNEAKSRDNKQSDSDNPKQRRNKAVCFSALFEVRRRKWFSLKIVHQLKQLDFFQANLEIHGATHKTLSVGAIQMELGSLQASGKRS